MKKKEKRLNPKRESVQRKNTFWKRDRTFILVLGGTLVAVISVIWIISATVGSSLSLPINPGVKLPSGGPIVAIHEMPTGPLPTVRPSSDGLYPDIELSSLHYDFGTVESEDNLEQTFQVANRGNADLVINQFYTTCGCTTARLTAGIIPPGQEAELTVYFDADFHPVEGRVERTVIIGSNDPDEPEVILTITVDVLPQ